MFEVKNYDDNRNIQIIDAKGPFTVVEFQKDAVRALQSPIEEYFAVTMGLKKRQVICDLDSTTKPMGITTQAGAMQWYVGNIKMVSDVNSVGNLLGNVIKSKATGDTTVKPVYKGDGTVVLEPTKEYLIISDISQWNAGMVVQDGMFLACESQIQQSVDMRKNLSSAIAGKEGLFNLKLKGQGYAVLKSPYPEEELIIVDLDNDELKVDGDYAIAWSGSLNFSVEKAGSSLVDSVMSKEKLVNIYRGTGRVMLRPI